jgi:hypothetical protein
MKELLLRKILFLQERASGKVLPPEVLLADDEVEDLRNKLLLNERMCEKEMEREREWERERERERKRDLARQRENDRERERKRNREREKERERAREKELERESDSGSDDHEKSGDLNAVASSDRTQNGIGGGSGPAVVLGSFAALQRRIRQEQETVERLVGERIEAHIAAMVADQLRARKREIHREVLVKVDRARQNMEAEVQLEIELMKKFRAKEQERRLAELQARMAEDDRQVEEEKRKLAEERLQILESQVPTVPILSAKLRIHDILGWVRIWIRGSMPLTNGSGSRRPKNMWIRIRIRIRNNTAYQ